MLRNLKYKKKSNQYAMFCPECGEKNNPNSKFCMNCGTQLPDEAKQPAKADTGTYNDYSQPRYEEPRYDQYSGGQSQGYSSSPQYQNRYQTSQPPGALPYICAFCVPIVGLILFFYYRNEHPEPAKNILIVAAVGFFLSFLGNLGASY